MTLPDEEGTETVGRNMLGRDILAFTAYVVLLAGFYSVVFFGERVFLSDGQLGHYFKPISLWDDSWAAGYYLIADPVSFSLYPLRIIFNFMLPSYLGFNLFVASAFLIAAFFTYHYIFFITNNWFAAFLGGVIFSYSGFMVGHLGHTTMIHAAAWMPLLFLSLENLKASPSLKWHLSYVGSIVMMILAGHIQIFVYAMLLAGFYTLLTFRGSWSSRFKFIGKVAMLTVLAVFLSAFQLIPTYELAQLGFRNEMSFSDFNSFSLSPELLSLFFFPHVY